MQKSKIKDAVIAVTYRCNSRCRMCNIWQIKEHVGELKAGDYKNLPASLRDINITGGEPFLRQDLGEIIKAINKQCPKSHIIFSTNGFATELIVEQVKKILSIKKNIGVTVSIDGIEEKHNQMRGIENGFQKAMHTVEELKKLNTSYAKGITVVGDLNPLTIKLNIAFTITDCNYQELPKVYKLAKENGMEFSVALAHSGENYFSKENRINKTNEIIKVLDWLVGQELKSWNWRSLGKAYFYYGLKEFAKTGKRILPDYSGELNVFIDPRGHIYPCDVSNVKIGKLDEEKITFYRNIEANKPTNNWMVCTVKQAMKKHFLKVGWWILKNKKLCQEH